MEKGLLPGNLHFHSPNPFSEGLAKGTLSVVDSTRPWQGGLSAVNSFGFGGTNVHLLLRGEVHQKLPQSGGEEESGFPTAIAFGLVPLSSRTEEVCRANLQPVQKQIT